MGLMRLLMPLFVILVIISSTVGTLAASEATRVAVFDFELIDSSLEGEIYGSKPEETERLGMISDLLREKLQASGRYEVVDTTPAEGAIADAGYIHGCNGCDAKIAHGLGADQAISGTVQKVSNLILNINLYVRDAASRRLIWASSVDVRGNTDTSWSRGVSYILRNRLLKGPAP
ncbi:MAG: DUF3280 domain-containing protein [Pseudomonadota bacterium]